MLKKLLNDYLINGLGCLNVELATVNFGQFFFILVESMIYIFY